MLEQGARIHLIQQLFIERRNSRDTAESEGIAKEREENRGMAVA